MIRFKHFGGRLDALPVAYRPNVTRAEHAYLALQETARQAELEMAI